MDTKDKMYISPTYDFNIPITNTCKHLMRALYRLVSKQSFDSISVKQICCEAAVSRSNFYNHFEDKFHLLLFYLHSIPSIFENKIDFNKDEIFFGDLLIYIELHNKFFSSLVLSNNNKELEILLEGTIYEDVYDFLWTQKTLNNSDDKNMLGIDVIFLTGGVSSLIRWWIINGFEKTSKEMAIYINQFMTNYVQ